MELVGPCVKQRLQTLLHKRAKDGAVVINDTGLHRLWNLCGQVAPNFPSWKRFSEFSERTATSFLLQEGPPVQYSAHVCIILFFDVLGIEVPPNEFEEYLTQEVLPIFAIADAENESLPTHCTQCGPEDILSMLDSDLPKESRAKARKSKASIYSGLSAAHSQNSATHESVKGNSDPDPDLDVPGVNVESSYSSQQQQQSQASSISAVDTESLLRLLGTRDAQIAKLRQEKKSLQQQLRRMSRKLESQSETHQQKLLELQNRKDFDLKRYDNDWEGRKKWSWLTPTGQVNAAAFWC